MVLSSLGAAYGIAKSGIGISAVSVMRPDMMVRSKELPFSRLPGHLLTTSQSDLMPPILAGILSIYGLVVAVIIAPSVKEKSALHTNFMQLGAGLTVGLSCLSAGFTIGIIGDAGVRAAGQQPRAFVSMMMMLIFAEVLGIYGLIVSLLLLTQSAKAGEITVCAY